ncbi:unnamed protein product [Sphagnum troendelagicum]|uniref:GOLD domain-containing protein n=1 Tax=Sphagnum troendelagicum TaxID=128251 RepID=A0ABP0U3A1_9BRYO
MIMACAAAGLPQAVNVLPRARSCHGCQALVVCKSTTAAAAFIVAAVHASLAYSGRIAVGGDWQDHYVHCIVKEIQSDVLVVGDYKVVSTSQDDLSVTAKVTSPRGKQLHPLENVHSGQFAFTSKESGKYVACFCLQSAHPNVHLNLTLDWKKGVGAKD